MSDVVLMVSQPGEAGVAHVVADQVLWAVQAGWSVAVACQPDSRLAQLVRERGGRVEPWVAQRGPGVSLIREARDLRRIVERTDPDLVHLHSSKAGLVGRLVLRGRRPCLFQPHAWSFEAGSGPMARATTRWERLAARWTDLVLCVSEAERERGAEAGVSCPVAVLPNTVDAAVFRPRGRAQARMALRTQFLVGDDEPLAVCLGRVCPQKGQDLLLAAWPGVREKVPGARLVLLGDGPDKEHLSAVAPSDVVFAGTVTDPSAWLQAADVVVMPSRWEGQALVLLEAMACGVSVVASDIPANAETLPAGAGAVVPAADATTLARTLTRRLRPGARSLTDAEGCVGRAHVVAHHSPASAARRLLDVYAWAVSGDADASRLPSL